LSPTVTPHALVSVAVVVLYPSEADADLVAVAL